jgi:hypothetical protein
MEFAIHTEEIVLSCQGSADASVQSVLIDWHFSCCLNRILCRSHFHEWREAGYVCYRGISILSVVLKLFEKMICDKIRPIIQLGRVFYFVIDKI